MYVLILVLLLADGSSYYERVDHNLTQIDCEASKEFYQSAIYASDAFDGHLMCVYHVHF